MGAQAKFEEYLETALQFENKLGVQLPSLETKVKALET